MTLSHLAIITTVMQEYHINRETGSEALHNQLSLKGRNLFSYMFMNFGRRCLFNKMQLFYSEEQQEQHLSEVV